MQLFAKESGGNYKMLDGMNVFLERMLGDDMLMIKKVIEIVEGGMVNGLKKFSIQDDNLKVRNAWLRMVDILS